MNVNVPLPDTVPIFLWVDDKPFFTSTLPETLNFGVSALLRYPLADPLGPTSTVEAAIPYLFTCAAKSPAETIFAQFNATVPVQPSATNRADDQVVVEGAELRTMRPEPVQVPLKA